MGNATKLLESSPNTFSIGFDEYKGFADNAPINIMYCDNNFNIVYANNQSLKTLKTIEQHLPISVDKIIGSSVDIFHKKPEHQRHILSDDKNLPHQAIITVGPEKLDLLVSPVYKGKEFIGTMVTWSVVTEKIKQEEELIRTQAMMDNATTNFMYCDLDFNITYMNPKSRETLSRVEQYLPIKLDDVVGSNIDVFHKHPAHQRKILADDKNLPHQAIIQLGPEKLDLQASAIYDKNKNYIGIMLTWDVVTERVRAEEELTRIQQMIENAPINIMMADRNYDIIFMNPKSRETLNGLQSLLPIHVDKIVGSSIDVFHKNPSHQRGLLNNDKNLPHLANIKLGHETLSLLATAIYDKQKNYIGAMVTWEVISDKVKLIESLTQASSQLSASAEELNATATQMTSNSEETTAQASAVATAAEKVSKGVSSVATNTEEMNASIKEISRNVQEASTKTNETKKHADETNTTIEQLGVSSQEIGKVIKVISSIAQQTNLLALNATIEAARAGEAGRGFAVVANEVKELAKQTATATEEITQKIEAIQSDTGGAVEAIKIIGMSIDSLNKVATTIATSVEEQAATTGEVSRIVQQSNQGVQGISENIREVSKAAQNTSQGAAQLVEAARSLSNLAEKMQDLVKEIRF